MNEVSINLDKVITKLLPSAIEKGLERCGQLIENEAKKRTPVDTGILRASMAHEVDGKKVTIYNNTEYAPIVHEVHKTKGQFLQRAVDENMDRLPKLFEKALEQEGL